MFNVCIVFFREHNDRIDLCRKFFLSPINIRADKCFLSSFVSPAMIFSSSIHLNWWMCKTNIERPSKNYTLSSFNSRFISIARSIIIFATYKLGLAIKWSLFVLNSRVFRPSLTIHHIIQSNEDLFSKNYLLLCYWFIFRFVTFEVRLSVQTSIIPRHLDIFERQYGIRNGWIL